MRRSLQLNLKRRIEKMNKLVARMRKTFDSSWLSSQNRDAQRNRSLLSILDVAVQQRQGTLMTLEQHGADKPFSVCVLASVLNHAIVQLEHGRPHAEPLHVTVVCALLGELCGSALCHNAADAGGIYPNLQSGDDAWRYAHEPLYYLRHALFHPGAILASRRIGSNSSIAIALNHVDTLSQYLVRRPSGTLSLKVAEVLERSRAAIAAEWTALWALEVAVGMGRYELAKIERSRSGSR